MQDIHDRRQHLEREFGHCQQRCQALTRDLTEAIYHRANSATDILFAVGKVSDDTVSINPKISVALSNRIRKSDVCIIISEVFGQYIRWMEFELGVAKSQLKPVI